MFHFGIKETFGLTDEAASLVPKAHPFVYTHQGNFPRFYAFILYFLGFKSPEWQIVVTTFTIGLAGIWLCHRFFSKYVSTLFALIVCFLLMTDYIMFAQWNVSTWRVWHLFFFFSSFLCCHGLIEKNWRIFIPLTIINFACLFYTEISYASFVFLSCCIYILFFSNIRLRVKINSIFLLCIGVSVGVAILIIQNIAYLGFDDFLNDLNYTYNGRNNSTSQSAIDKIIQFYRDHYIVFWINFNSENGIRNPISILHNFYYYCLGPYGPFITLSALISIIGTVINIIVPKLKATSRIYCDFFSYINVLFFFIACLMLYHIDTYS
jgi:hypothetical protein